MPSETEAFRRHFYIQTASRLFEFVGVLQADDVGFVSEMCGRRAFAVYIAAACLRRAVAGVVDVDVGVGGIDDVVFTNIVFHTGGEPDAVAVGQAVHAVVGVADGRFVKSDTGAQLQRFADLIRTAESDFVGVAPVGGDGGAVGCFVYTDGFFFFKNSSYLCKFYHGFYLIVSLMVQARILSILNPFSRASSSTNPHSFISYYIIFPYRF